MDKVGARSLTDAGESLFRRRPVGIADWCVSLGWGLLAGVGIGPLAFIFFVNFELLPQTGIQEAQLSATVLFGLIGWVVVSGALLVDRICQRRYGFVRVSDEAISYRTRPTDNTVIALDTLLGAKPHRQERGRQTLRFFVLTPDGSLRCHAGDFRRYIPAAGPALDAVGLSEGNQAVLAAVALHFRRRLAASLDVAAFPPFDIDSPVMRFDWRTLRRRDKESFACDGRKLYMVTESDQYEIPIEAIRSTSVYYQSLNGMTVRHDITLHIDERWGGGEFPIDLRGRNNADQIILHCECLSALFLVPSSAQGAVEP